MAQRAVFTDSALIRQLNRLRDADGVASSASVSNSARAAAGRPLGEAADRREPPQGFAERLSQWLGWSQAISLSSVLNAPPAGVETVSWAYLDAVEAEASECAAVRQSLMRSIRDDKVPTTGPGRAPRQLLPGEVPAPPATDFAPYRQRYVTRQQAMEAGVDALRERLRSRLATCSPQAARLAAVDAVMEQVLGARERGLLSSVPAALEAHFKRLRRAAVDTEGASSVTASSSPATWLNVFRQDMQALLLAELDFRFQPVEGLLEALRAHPERPSAFHA